MSRRRFEAPKRCRSACGNKITPKLCSRVCRLTAVRLRMFSSARTRRNCSFPVQTATDGASKSRNITNPPRRYANSQTYSPAPVASKLAANSGEKPSWTDGSTARQRSEMQITALPVGSGATSRSRMLCMLGTRSLEASSRMGSTPRVEKANAFSWTALRSFSNSTIAMAMPSNNCGTGLSCPATPSISASAGLN